MQKAQASFPVNSDVSIDYLADHPKMLARAAGWLQRQWLEEWGYSRRQAVNELRARLNRTRVPMALVALAGERSVGVASLIELAWPEAEKSLYCLAGVFVLPAWRRQGIGQLLCRRAVLEAERLQLPTLGLFTNDCEKFYAKMGWKRVMDAIPPHAGQGELVAFMELEVGARGTKQRDRTMIMASARCA